jgi:hypothetical protein
VILNLHERWLLRSVGVGRAERLELFAATESAVGRADEIDLAAQLGQYTLAKRSIRDDLPALFDQISSHVGGPVHGVAYGDRRYRRQVILAAALRQAGISPSSYRSGLATGCRTLANFKALS